MSEGTESGLQKMLAPSPQAPQSADELEESHQISRLHMACPNPGNEVSVGESPEADGSVLKVSEVKGSVQVRSAEADLNLSSSDSSEGDAIISRASHDPIIQEDSQHICEGTAVQSDSPCSPSVQDYSECNAEDLRLQDESTCNGKNSMIQEPCNGENLLACKKEEGSLERNGDSQLNLQSRAMGSQTKQPVKKAAQKQQISIPEVKQPPSRKVNRPSNVSTQKFQPSSPKPEKGNIISPTDDVKLNGSLPKGKMNQRHLSSQSLHAGSPRAVPCSPSGLASGSPQTLPIRDLPVSLRHRDSSGPLPPNSPVVNPLRPLKITVPLADKISKLPSSKGSPRPLESSISTPKSIISTQALENKFSEYKISQGSPDTERARRRVKDLLHKKKTDAPFGAGMSVLLNNEIDKLMDDDNLASRKNPDMGPFLLNLAKSAIASGDHPYKALELAARAAKSFERSSDGKPSLEHVTSLHILAAIYCSLGQFEEAIPVLQQAIALSSSDSGGLENALVEFAGHMQLGDTFSLLGRSENALGAYHAGLEVQKVALGDMDPLVGETYRYLAEAHVQAMQFARAEDLCNLALQIHKEHSAPASIEEATDRRLMGLILNGKGEYEAALEHLVLASMALIANEQEVDVAAVDVSIGDTYVSLRRFDEAVFSYQKALTVFKSAKGENHASVASVYVSLAELYLKTGKLRESKAYCESALRIYSKQGAGHQPDEIASGSIEIAAIYEALNEQEQALSLLHKALDILESVPGQQCTVAGIQAQVGVLYYNMGNYKDACFAFQNAVSKFKSCGEMKSSLIGILLNQVGLSFVQLSKVEEAAEAFEEARRILEESSGPYHPDTLATYSNLAGAYDALGRLSKAIQALEYVVEAREEKLGTANPDVDEEKRRLAELLKEAGRSRTQRLNGSLELLMHSNTKHGAGAGQSVSANGPGVVC